MDKTEEAGHFKRDLGVYDSTMLVIGSMIGSGIFIVSADIARTVGSPGYLLLVWLITGVLTMTAALSYGELAGMMPQAGGQYVYLREAYNPLVGFLYGWTFFLVIQTGTIAAVAVAFAKFTGVLIPWFSEKHILVSVAGRGISAAQCLAIVSIVALTYINVLGVHTGKLVQNVFTTAKVVALSGLILLGFAIGANATAVGANFSDLWNASRTALAQDGTLSVTPLAGIGILTAMGVAMVGSLFSSDAWNNITFTAAEVINPKRTIPMSLALGTGIVTLIYIVANVAYLVILPLAGHPDGAGAMERGIQFATSDRVGTSVASILFGEPASIIMAVLIMVSTFGCNNGLILSGARLSFAMAKDRLFFQRAGTLNERGVPAWALVIQAIWASLLCLSGTYGDLLDYVVFAVLLFYILTIAGIFRLRASRPDAERPYRAIGYPFLPALYIVVAAAICVDLLIYKPMFSFPGLGIVLLGIPVYFVWHRRGASA